MQNNNIINIVRIGCISFMQNIFCFFAGVDNDMDVFLWESPTFIESFD